MTEDQKTVRIVVIGETGAHAIRALALVSIAHDTPIATIGRLFDSGTKSRVALDVEQAEERGEPEPAPTIDHETHDQLFLPFDQTPQERLLERLYAPRDYPSVPELLHKAVKDVELQQRNDISASVSSGFMQSRREDYLDHPKGPPKRSNKLLRRPRKGCVILR